MHDLLKVISFRQGLTASIWTTASLYATACSIEEKQHVHGSSRASALANSEPDNRPAVTPPRLIRGAIRCSSREASMSDASAVAPTAPISSFVSDLDHLA